MYTWYGHKNASKWVECTKTQIFSTFFVSFGELTFFCNFRGNEEAKSLKWNKCRLKQIILTDCVYYFKVLSACVVSLFGWLLGSAMNHKERDDIWKKNNNWGYYSAWLQGADSLKIHFKKRKMGKFCIKSWSY